MIEFVAKARRKAAEGIDKGFTLIELLITVVILGVLAGIVVFAVSAFTGQGETAACKSDLKNVEIASQAYYAKNHSYASAIDDASHTSTTLVGSGILKEAPSSDKYSFTYTAATGDVAANPANCSGLG